MGGSGTRSGCVYPPQVAYQLRGRPVLQLDFRQGRTGGISGESAPRSAVVLPVEALANSSASIICVLLRVAIKQAHDASNKIEEQGSDEDYPVL